MLTAGEMAAKREERRKLVMVGDLPEDFLRVSAKPSSTSSQQESRVNFRPSNIAGTLSVTVVNAELVKNYGFTKMDPYVAVRIGHDLYETPTDLRGSKRPTWNKTFQSYLPQGIQTIFFDIYDERALVPDERIAWGTLTLPAQLFKGEFLDTWVPLSGKQGEGKEGRLHVICNFAPSSIQVSSVAYPSAPVMMFPSMHYNSFPSYYNTMVQYPTLNQQWPVNPDYITVSQQNSQPVSKNDLKQLEEMFPSFDKETIVAVLQSCGQKKDQAINALLSMSNDN